MMRWDASGAIKMDAYCNYADEEIPAGCGALGGIVDYSGGKYSLRITNHEIYF